MRREAGGSLPVGRPEASLWEMMKLSGGKGASFLVEREQASRWEGSKLLSGNG